ncbi:hypothetical protein ACVV62_00175 [Streptococcus pluranimalium]
MGKLSKVTAYGFLTIMALNTLAPAATTATVFANTHVESPSEVVTNAEYIPTAQELAYLDQYISVEENKFVLNIPEGVEVSEELTVFVNDKLNKTNIMVEQNGLVINEVTKVISNPDLVSFRTAKAINVTNHWWGVKYTSTSYSGAIDTRVVFENHVAAAALAAAILGVATAKVAGAGGILPALDGFYNQTIVNEIQGLIDKGEANNGITVDVNSWVPHFAVYPTK